MVPLSALESYLFYFCFSGPTCLVFGLNLFFGPNLGMLSCVSSVFFFFFKHHKKYARLERNQQILCGQLLFFFLFIVYNKQSSSLIEFKYSNF